jgi:hypothetical protein
MPALIHLLQLVSLAGVALFAGTMLTEGFVLVPYWRSLGAADFFGWYAANAKRLLDFFGPVTWLGGLSALAAAVASWWTSHPGRWPAAIAAAAMLLAVATFFLYFERANAGFTAATIPADDLPAQLALWARWHWARTTLSLVAVLAAALALRSAASPAHP